eukprot:scaffold6774_cov66-Phaeocystis_antarctica.AAC.2
MAATAASGWQRRRRRWRGLGEGGEGGNGGGEGGDGQCAFWLLEQYSVIPDPAVSISVLVVVSPPLFLPTLPFAQCYGKSVEIIPVFRPQPGQTCSQLKVIEY